MGPGAGHQQHEVCVEACSQQCVLLGPILSSVLFNIINDLDDGVECTLSKFADDIKAEGVTDAPESCAIIQRYLSKVEK